MTLALPLSGCMSALVEFNKILVSLQSRLLDLQIDRGVRVNYTGSWMKTVSWLHWLTLLIARTQNSGKKIIPVLYCRGQSIDIIMSPIIS